MSETQHGQASRAGEEGQALWCSGLSSWSRGQHPRLGFMSLLLQFWPSSPKHLEVVGNVSGQSLVYPSYCRRRGVNQEMIYFFVLCPTGNWYERSISLLYFPQATSWIKKGIPGWPYFAVSSVEVLPHWKHWVLAALLPASFPLTHQRGGGCRPMYPGGRISPRLPASLRTWLGAVRAVEQKTDELSWSLFSLLSVTPPRFPFNSCFDNLAAHFSYLFSLDFCTLHCFLTLGVVKKKNYQKKQNQPSKQTKTLETWGSAFAAVTLAECSILVLVERKGKHRQQSSLGDFPVFPFSPHQVCIKKLRTKNLTHAILPTLCTK